MKIIYSLLLCIALSVQASDTTFTKIQSRVTRRNKITKAILAIDNGLRFKLKIKGDQAEVTIWKHMKVRDPNMEKYTFKLSDEIQQEYARLKFQDELQALINQGIHSERKFRISKYKKHNLQMGMPYKDVKKLLGNEFKSDGRPRAEAGAYRLESKTHIMVFRHIRLIDIVANYKEIRKDVMKLAEDFMKSQADAARYSKRATAVFPKGIGVYVVRFLILDSSKNHALVEVIPEKKQCKRIPVK